MMASACTNMVNTFPASCCMNLKLLCLCQEWMSTCLKIWLWFMCCFCKALWVYLWLGKALHKTMRSLMWIWFHFFHSFLDSTYKISVKYSRIHDFIFQLSLIGILASLCGWLRLECIGRKHGTNSQVPAPGMHPSATLGILKEPEIMHRQKWFNEMLVSRVYFFFPNLFLSLSKSSHSIFFSLTQTPCN